MSNEILLLAEGAELTRQPEATLRFYRYRGEGGPRSFKLGNRVVYRRADVEAWIEAQYNDGAAGAARLLMINTRNVSGERVSGPD